MNMRVTGKARTIAAAAGLALIAATAAQPAAALDDTIDVKIDFAKIVKLERPAGTIVIGNPGIADASVQDDQTLVLTGKSAGSTNMIILDTNGVEVANTTIRVSSNLRRLTTVFYGSKRQTLSCAPTCEQVVSVGDAQELFDTAKTQIEGRQQFSTAK